MLDCADGAGPGVLGVLELGAELYCADGAGGAGTGEAEVLLPVEVALGIELGAGVARVVLVCVLAPLGWLGPPSHWFKAVGTSESPANNTAIRTTAPKT